LKSCQNLYFRRPKPYADKHRRNLRNRSYNIHMKYKYKKAMKKVIRYCKNIMDGINEREFASMQEIIDGIQPYLDTAMITIDEVCVQGFIHRNYAARRKEKLCRYLFNAGLSKGLVEKPADRYIPKKDLIPYDIPPCYKTREPRPWQLPGWKSPWMLKREYEKWRASKGLEPAFWQQ